MVSGRIYYYNAVDSAVMTECVDGLVYEWMVCYANESSVVGTLKVSVVVVGNDYGVHGCYHVPFRPAFPTWHRELVRTVGPPMLKLFRCLGLLSTLLTSLRSELHLLMTPLVMLLCMMDICESACRFSGATMELLLKLLQFRIVVMRRGLDRLPGATWVSLVWTPLVPVLEELSVQLWTTRLHLALTSEFVSRLSRTRMSPFRPFSPMT